MVQEAHEDVARPSKVRLFNELRDVEYIHTLSNTANEFLWTRGVVKGTVFEKDPYVAFIGLHHLLETSFHFFYHFLVNMRMRFPNIYGIHNRKIGIPRASRFLK